MFCACGMAQKASHMGSASYLGAAHDLLLQSMNGQDGSICPCPAAARLYIPGCEPLLRSGLINRTIAPVPVVQAFPPFLEGQKMMQSFLCSVATSSSYQYFEAIHLQPLLRLI